MTSHTNEALLRRFYDEVYSKGKLSVVDELVDRNFVEHEPLPPVVPVNGRDFDEAALRFTSLATVRAPESRPAV